MQKELMMIDIDDTLLDSRLAFLERYNLVFDTNYTFQDLTPNQDYSATFTRWTSEDIYNIFQEETFYDDVFLVDFAVLETLKELSREYDICLCSIHNPKNVASKSRRIEELTLKKYISQEIYLSNFFRSKNFIQCDVFIDDRLENILSNPARIKILFDKYNLYTDRELPTNVERVTDWKDVRNAINRTNCRLVSDEICNSELD